MLMEELDDSSACLPFAYPLKLATTAVMEQMGLTDAEATRYVYEDKDTPVPQLGGRTGRDFLVKIDTEVGRYFVGKDVWVKRHERLRHEALGWIIVDDVRMHNEYGSIKDAGGWLIKVMNPRKPAVVAATEGNLCGLPFDFTIANDGTLSQLRRKVVDVLARIGAPIA